MTSTPNLSDLFAQLGLNNSPEEIRVFIKDHQLTNTEPLDEAPFFDDAQVAFIRESWLADAEWVYAIDQLNIALHHSINE